MTTERSIDAAIGRMITREFPEAFHWKPSERFVSGIPDRVGCFRGRFFAIEVKRPGGKTTKIQDHVLKKIVGAQGSVCIAYSVEYARFFMRGIKEGTW